MRFGAGIVVAGCVGCAVCGRPCTTCPRPCVNAKSKKPRYREIRIEMAMTRIV